MELLDALPSISRLSKTVTRVLGQNPGKFTLQGTNTYLLGERNPYILVDTGEGKDTYAPLLQEALLDPAREHDTSVPRISDIVLTHRHHDHTNGLPSIPLPTPNTGLSTLLSSFTPDSFAPSPSGAPLHDLADGDTLPVTSSSPTPATLRVLHTPGHTPDSLCLFYAPDRALFTADTVLGQGSSVFEDLGPYMRSLAAMTYTRLYPGHGPVVEDGLVKVETYLKHRVEREEQIVRVLQAEGEREEGRSVEEIVATIYARYPKDLWGPAAHSVGLHLTKLLEDGRVEKVGEKWVVIA
ncbi:Metallo-hydrolase/oxidoreductase [Epithele typhae]|uniref:Metallo-hydrolase/oxidoreductase n=1 Tax=Epithele typhae TaxID=378194 RepID=UPI0020073B72|nr:Metallo-hydrolase/oxidoreductase [Epithele typhae]KAH9918402.1 Metallo-hydrolase/oxidoreductase [Epithele typhae]